MKSIILKTLNGRPEEFASIGLMLILGFFTGVFLASYDVAALALFLEKFEDNAILAQAILLSGVLSVVSTYGYSFLQRKIPFRHLVSLFLLVILAATAIIWEQSSAANANNTIVFIGFILALPFSFTASLIFWGYFGRVFNLKQSKRVVGGIDTGQLMASIISLFAIGYILDNNVVTPPQLYVGSVVGIIGMFITALFTNSLIKGSVSSGFKQIKAQSFIKIFGNRYTKWMTLFVIISIIATTFVHYSFLSVTNIQWTTVAEKGAFLAKFEATVVIFSFLFQTFVTDLMIENYGLKTSLLVNPILAILLAVMAVLVGLFMGYSAETSSNFIWFFLAIAASKLFIDALKDALDGPTFKLYFLPIDSDVKFDVITKVEGVIAAIGAVIAGLILIAMNTFNVELLYVSLGLIPLLLIWYATTNRMHSGYRSSLQYTLVKNKLKTAKNSDSKREEPEDQKLNSLKFLEKTNPAEFEKTALDLIQKVEGPVQDYLKHKINKMNLEFDSKPNSIEANQELKKLASQAANEANTSDVISISPDRLYTLSKSHLKEDRLLATKLLRSLISDKSIFVLLELLRDQNNDVKLQAIITARKVKRKETWPLLIELLGNKTYTYEASSALIEAGESLLPSLENAFHRSGQKQQVMLKLIAAISEIDTDAANDLLWSKIEFPDRKIVRQILLSFRNKHFQATEKERSALNNLLSDEIGKTIWNLAAISELSNKPYNDLLKQALEDEVSGNYSMIFMILSMLYERHSIQLVKENIEEGTSEGNTFALELLDIFIAPDLKPKLFPILDDIETNEKLTKLQHFYPRQSYDEATTYNFLLNRDFNNINRWTKACTLYALQFNLLEDVKQSIIAQMFNPDLLLSELAASILYKEDDAIFNNITARILVNNSIFNSVVERIQKELPTKFKICQYLAESKVFSFLSGLHISQIIDDAELVEMAVDEELSISDDRYCYMVFEGTPQVFTKNGIISSFSKKDVIGNMFSMDANKLDKLVAKHPTKLFKLTLNDVFDVLTNYKNQSQQIIYTASKNLQTHFFENNKT